MYSTTQRALQWMAILLVVFGITGGYFYFKGKAAQTITTGSDAARPDFEIPLKTNLHPIRGTGIPSYSRSDGADRRATITDFEGLVHSVKANEARFDGARRVENLITYSENPGDASWSNSTVMLASGFTDPNGGMHATRVSATGANAFISHVASSAATGRTYTHSIWVRRVSGTGSVALHGDTIGEIAITSQVTTSWKRFSNTFTTTDGNLWAGIRLGTSGDVVDVAFAQVEEVTGQANQNPSEYVSTNVKTTSPYHGAGVDGVRYFDYQNSNTVASNVVTEAKGTTISETTLKGYLAEGSRTNLRTYSQDCSNSVWVLNNATWTAKSSGAATAPDGSANGCKLSDADTSSNVRVISASGATVSAGAITGSIYVKAGEYNSLAFYLSSGSGAHAVRVLVSNLDTSAFIDAPVVWWGTDLSAPTASIKSVGNGWWRVTLTATSAAGSSGAGIGIYNKTSVGAYTGVVGNGIYFWGGQLEQASFASSFIPTTSASVTRAADSLSYPMYGDFEDAQGSLAAEINTLWSSASAGTTISTRFVGDSLDAQYLSLWHWNGLANHIGAERKGGTTRNNPDYTSQTIVSGQTMRMAMSYDSTAVKLFSDGALRMTDNTLTLPYNSLNGRTLRISYGNESFANIKNVRSWKKAMSDTFLNNLTAGQSAIIKQTTGKTADNTGLAGYWSFEDGSGTKATDFSGNNNTGTLTNGPTWVDGKFGKAMNFSSASSQYVPIGNVSSLKNSSFTYAAWVNPASLSGGMTIFGGGANSTPRIRIDSGSGTIALVDTGIVVIGTSSGTVPTNEWSHIAVTYNTNGNYTVYINGTAVGSGTNIQTFSFTSASFEIGRNGAGTNEYFDGKIDDIRIYNRSLSSDDILRLYQGTFSVKTNVSQNEKSTNGLVGLWSFNGPDLSGATAYDRSGNGNNGTLTSGPVITEGKVGQALSFDGTNDYVSTADVDVFSPANNALSVSFWAKVPISASAVGNGSGGNAGAYIVAKGVNTQWEWTFENDNNSKIFFSIFNLAGSSGMTITSTRTVNDGAWHHYIGTVDYGASSMALYIDGVSAGTASSMPTMGNGTQPIEIGRRGDGNYFTGAVDEVRIYNKILSANERQELYQMGR